MAITLNGTTGITTPGLTNAGGLSGTTGTFSGLISANGGQIAFPATQNPSSDANTLDDYEEGTWTPTQGAGLTVVGSFSSSGKYTKIGNVVTVYFQVNGSTSVACAGANQICGGMPFAGAGQLYTGSITDNNNTNLGVSLQYVSGMYSTTAISARSMFCGSVTYLV